MSDGPCVAPAKLWAPSGSQLGPSCPPGCCSLWRVAEARGVGAADIQGAGPSQPQLFAGMLGGSRAAAGTAEHRPCSPQTTPFTTSTLSPTTRAPPWGDTTLPTARALSPASGTVSMTPGEAACGTGAAAGSGRAGSPCPGHPGASSPMLTAHIPISTVLPQCHPATSAAAMPTCSSTSWPAHLPACSQPCRPGDPCTTAQNRPLQVSAICPPGARGR